MRAVSLTVAAREKELAKVGAEVARYRARTWKNQKQFAATAGVGSATLARIETGAVVPHRRTMELLAKALGVPREVLVPFPERIWGKVATPK